MSFFSIVVIKATAKSGQQSSLPVSLFLGQHEGLCEEWLKYLFLSDAMQNNQIISNQIKLNCYTLGESFRFCYAEHLTIYFKWGFSFSPKIL